MARSGGVAGILKIIIQGDARGAQDSVRDISTDLKQFARDALAIGGLDFLKGATESASSLLESQNKVNQVFGAAAPMVREFGASAADALGQSEQAVNQATGTYGNLLQAFGLTQDQAAGMSVTLVKLASDLAAFNDVPVEEVITSLRAAIAGEIEPARRLGINLLDVRLKGEAMAMGLYDGVGALDASAKAQAAYTAILEDTAIAQGQFERESEGLLAQQMKARAEWENTKADLGTELIPAFTLATKAVAGLSSAVGALPGPLQLALIGSTGLVVVWPRLVAVAAMATDAMLNFRLGLMGVTQQGAGAANALGGVLARVGQSPALMAGAAVGVGALTIALIEMSNSAKDAKKNADDLVTTAAATGESIEKIFNEKLAKTLANISGGFDIGSDGGTGVFLDAVNDVGVGADELSAALRGTDEEFQAFRDSFQQGVLDSGNEETFTIALRGLDRLRDSGVRAETQQRDLEEANRSLGVATDAASAAVDENSVATERNIIWLHKQETVIDNLNAAMERRLSKMEGQISAEEALTGAQVDLWNSTAELADAQQAAAGNSEEMASAREAEADAAKSLADAEDAVADAERGVADAQDQVRERREALNEAWAEAEKRIGDTARAARQAALDESQAVLDVRSAEIELQRVLSNSGSTQLEKDQARQDLAEAVAARDQAAADAAAARLEALNAQNPANDEGVIAAREALADAEDGVTEARKRVRDATDQVAEAHRRLDDAARNTAKVAEDASRRLVEAQAANEDAILRVAQAEGDVAAAAGTAEDGIRAWQRALSDISADLDPNSPLRTRIRALIEDLGRVLSGGLGPGGQYGSPDAADRGGDVPNGPARPGDFGSPDAGDRARPMVVNNWTVIGTDVETRRRMRQEQDDRERRMARALSGG